MAENATLGSKRQYLILRGQWEKKSVTPLFATLAYPGLLGTIHLLCLAQSILYRGRGCSSLLRINEISGLLLMLAKDKRTVALSSAAYPSRLVIELFVVKAKRHAKKFFAFFHGSIRSILL